MRVLNLGDYSVKIYSKRRDLAIPRDAKYVGRPSILGNPFSHKSGILAVHRVDSIEEAISNFEAYARSRMTWDSGFRKAVAGCYQQDLVCWCADLCHADIVAKLAKEVCERS